jgi:aldo/keto reductase family protein
MEYRLLGSSGCAVSALALGTLTFGNETDQATSFSQLDRFTEAGGTLVDSADVYADGRAVEWEIAPLRERTCLRDLPHHVISSQRCRPSVLGSAPHSSSGTATYVRALVAQRAWDHASQSLAQWRRAVLGLACDPLEDRARR